MFVKSNGKHSFISIINRFISIILLLISILSLLGGICECISPHVKSLNNFYNYFIKRCFDIIISGVALIFLWPLFIFIGILIVLEDGFPVFYHADRVGYRNKQFRICKFRSMIKDADKVGTDTTAFNDPRITKTGYFLRKTKLDELPQLVQVFLGRMSLIGPRPELPRYVSRYKGEEKDILKVRPGITDFSSIEFINLDEIVGDRDADKMYERYVLKEKNALRVKYVQQISFKTDIYILFKTVSAVFGKIFAFTVKGKHR